MITEVRQALAISVDEKTRRTGQNFFKEKILLYGVRIPIVRKIARESFEKIKDKPTAEIYSLCEELWKSGYTEESYIACDWSYFIHPNYAPADFKVFEEWINKYVDNWASCDTLCNHTVGAFIELYPEYVDELKKWAQSANRWTKRAAAVSLIIPARKGLFLKDIIEIADILMMDTDDLVQKGYGWMLKAASEAHTEEIYKYVLSHKAYMPRTAYRYAIEKMPADLKAKAMEK